MDTDLRTTTTTDLSGLSSYSVSSSSLDVASPLKETFYNNPNWSVYLGYYKTIPELKSAIDSMVMWTIGKGYSVNISNLKNQLDNIRGWGEDSFLSILRNHDTITMINGDAYTEAIRKKNGRLLNLKPLNPAFMRTVVNDKGIIIRYEEVRGKNVIRKLKPSQVLHSTENRIGSEIHGVSKIEAVKWIIDARNAAMSDLRRVMHRSTIRVLYVDEDDTSRLITLKTQYKEGLANGDVLIIPARKGEAEFQDLSVPPVTAYMEWIKYLENVFYKQIGVPEIILGGSQNYTEASSKVGYLTFEQPYMARQKRLEEDLKNQLGIDITFNRPVSLKDNIQSDEAKNTGQVSLKSSELNTGITRNE